jgi:hypothetical protein
MAEIIPEEISSGGMWRHVVWRNVTAGDTCRSLATLDFNDKFVQAFGAYDGETVTIKGSADERANYAHPQHASASWVLLTDNETEDLSFMADSGKQITEHPAWIKPTISAGAGTTSVTITLYMVRNAR